MARDQSPDEIVKEEMRDKLRSPFYVSLLIAFILWNWRAVVIMVSPYADVGLAERFLWIEAYYPTYPWFRTILMPILSASIAVAGLPWIINLLEDLRHAAYVQRENNQKERDIKLHKVQKTIAELEGRINELRESNQRIGEENKMIHSTLNKERNSMSELVRRYVSTAAAAIAADQELHQVLLDIDLQVANIPLDTSIGTRLIRYGIVEQSGQQFQLTQHGNEVVKYMRENIIKPK